MKSMALAVLFLALAGSVATADEGTKITPLFDFRVRQEVLDNVFFFDPTGATDRNWVRFRTRAGLAIETGAHDFALRFNNEARYFIQPSDEDFYWDELMIDRAYWRWQTGESATLKIGRQDIMWNRGFIMFDGTPLDGSRSAYHNAARMQADVGEWDLDVCLIINPKYDPIVLVKNEKRPLTDADEYAAVLRADTGPWQFAGIWKVEDDPDGRLPWLRTATMDVRFDARFSETGKIWAEMAAQHQHFNDSSSTEAAPADGWGWAGQIFASSQLSQKMSGEFGGFYYSGDDGAGVRAFRTPWGRWPKWSDLYIYALIGESTPGRAHVAAWENVAAPRAMLRFAPTDFAKVHVGLTWLMAPQPDWQARGTLLQVGLEWNMTALTDGLKSHLIWETLDPGSFYTDQLDPELTDTWHFLRWQVTYALK